MIKVFLITILTLLISVIIGTYIALREFKNDRDVSLACSFLIPYEIIHMVITKREDTSKYNRVGIWWMRIKVLYGIIKRYPDILPAIGAKLYELQSNERRETVRVEFDVRDTSKNLRSLLLYMV